MASGHQVKVNRVLCVAILIVLISLQLVLANSALTSSLIELRIIYLQGKQLGLLPESHHQGWALAHPLERATRMDGQLGEGARAEVG
jgi:hypothetical protein